MTQISRRSLLAGGAALAALGVTGCSRSPSISQDPSELVLWYWSRSISEKLLDVARTEIPDTTKRLRTDIIGGAFDTKFRTSLAGDAYIPDVTALNSNVSIYFPNEDKFTDLNELGAADLKSEFLDWKWNLGTTETGRMCFWPMDTGPTGFYYRKDLFDQAGLPTSTDGVSDAVKTWDGYIEVGSELRKSGDIAIVDNAGRIFTSVINSNAERYFDAQGNQIFREPGSAIREAWEVAVKASQAGVTARLGTDTDTESNSAYNSGKIAGRVEAVWWATILKDLAPDSSGDWGVASQPKNAGNSGGSFLTIPTTSKDPQAAFDFITWLTTAEHQAQSYEELALFPSSIKALENSSLAAKDDFFDDQDIFTFFQASAKDVPITFISPYEGLVNSPLLTELTNVDANGKDPDQAWADAMVIADRQLAKKGLQS